MKEPKPKTIAIDAALHKRVKVIAAETNKSVRRYIEIAIIKELPRLPKEKR